jgi:hypothetical protein
MELNILSEDHLKVLSTTKYVVERAKDVIINPRGINPISKMLEPALNRGINEAEYGLGLTGKFEDDVQLIFLEDTVNFCFWAEKDKPKWQIEWPIGSTINGGYYGLVGCYKRAFAEKTPILDANYLSSITLEQVKHFFRGKDGTEIPLIDKRLDNFREAGKVLLKKYRGHFIHTLEDSKFDTVGLVKEIVDNFTSFRDSALYNNKRINFLKRAQLAANDLSFLSEYNKKGNLKNLNELTAFADYKIPQILRMFGVISYSKRLGDKIDNYVLIPAGSREETEIRAATIWAVELIRQKMDKYSARMIDNAIWLASQDLSKETKPYHRTYTVFY